MAKYKRYDYSQSMLIPVFFEEQLMPGTYMEVGHITGIGKQSVIWARQIWG